MEVMHLQPGSLSEDIIHVDYHLKQLAVSKNIFKEVCDDNVEFYLRRSFGSGTDLFTAYRTMLPHSSSRKWSAHKGGNVMLKQHAHQRCNAI